MKRVDVVYCLIVNDMNKVLIVMNKNEGAKGGIWTLPGGLVEKGETLEEAVKREVKEETGLLIEPAGVVAVNECKFIEKWEHALFITFASFFHKGSVKISQPDEIVQIKWVDIEEANALMPYYKGDIEGMIGRSIKYINQGRV